MCRMSCTISNAPFVPRQHPSLTSKYGLINQVTKPRMMDRPNLDGHGMAVLQSSGDWWLAKSNSEMKPTSAVLYQGETTAALSHIRLATSGMTKGMPGVAPWIADTDVGEVAFAMNGKIPSYRSWPVIASGPYTRYGGETDSLHLLEVVKDLIAEEGGILNALEALPAFTSRWYDFAEYSIIILDQDEAVYALSNGRDLYVHTTRSAGDRQLTISSEPYTAEITGWSRLSPGVPERFAV